MTPVRGSHSSRLGWVGGALLLAIGLVALAAPGLAPFDPRELVGPSLAPPGGTHLLGTNDVGQDILSRLIYGARLSLWIGVVASVAATMIGTFVGLVAGYRRGAVDLVLMRLVDTVLALPFLPLLIVLQVFVGAGLTGMVLVLVAVMWARPARELRAHVLASREALHVQAAKAMGASDSYILIRHLLPGLAPLVAPQFVRILRGAILSEASLSFLGLGDPTAVTWGAMLFHAQARSAYLTGAWVWWILPPGLLIGAVVVGAALIGYVIEERSRPRLTGDWRPGGLAPGDVLDNRSVPLGSSPPVLRLAEVRVDYGDAGAPALADVSFTVHRGEVVGLVGDSGGGKSTLAMTAMGLLRRPARLRSGLVAVEGEALAGLQLEDLRRLRGRRIAMVPQGSQSALNPVRTARWQVVEALRAHGVPAVAAKQRAGDLLDAVGIGRDRQGAFPHELSGGMRQRVVIGMALAHDPVLVVADEPTTGLDVVTQRSVLDLLVRLRKERGLAVLLVSHDLNAIEHYADRVFVMKAGKLTQAPNPGSGPSTVRSWPVPKVTNGIDGASALLRLTGVSRSYRGRGGGSDVHALSNVSLEVAAGEAVCVVGMSGAGKSTLTRLIMGLEAPDTGTVWLDGRTLLEGDPITRTFVSSRMHLVFQDPYASLPPHFTVREVVGEPLMIHGVPASARRERIEAAMTDCGLAEVERFLDRHPHQLSGGERQRVALARAYVMMPRILIADEPTSLLDGPLRAELQELIRQLCDTQGTTLMYVTHDLRSAASLCQRMVVIDGGRIVEEGPTVRLLECPEAPGTRRLVDAVGWDRTGS